MMQTVDASKLSLNDVHKYLKLEKGKEDSFEKLLSLEPITELEQQEVWKIANDFERYQSAGKISEGLIKFLTLAPLMRLTGFYDASINLTIEDSIIISVENEDTTITGRLDILAVNAVDNPSTSPLWILVIESKNSTFDISVGLPQLLTYAFNL